MATFVFRRLLWTIPVTFVAVTMIFFLMRAIGGNPFRHGPLLGLTTPGGGWTKYGDFQPEAIENNLARRYGLDLPWYEQYANFLEGVVTFDFGPSLSFRNQTVNGLLAETAPSSLELGLLALAWAILLGVPAAVFAALRPNTGLDYCVRLLSSIGFAVPNFLLALVMLYFANVWFGTTIGGLMEPQYLDQPMSWGKFVSVLQHLWIPVIIIGTSGTAAMIRRLRANLFDELQKPYYVTAKAKGLRPGRALAKYPLRMSLNPFIADIGNLLPDPAVLFLILLIVIWILSAIMAPMTFADIDPRTGLPIQINNQLRGEAIAHFLATMTATFCGPKPS
jgi:peptide/nickel transport system permease protein